jgi:homoserine O-succinyltransferase
VVVNIDSSRSRHDRPASSATALGRAAPLQRANGTNQCITIGLLNNMAGTAFKATERQFISLLDSASEGIPIHVSFYTLPGLSRTESGGSHFASHYASVEALLDTRLDGLIVTGREPKMASLRDEPYWQSFTQVLEWARDNTHSTIWSCLAAHAAILHMDGIERRKSEEKNFGVFECARDSDHPLTQDLAPHFRVPHSRWNGVAREDLMARGYSILSQVCGKGVDAFVKEEKSLFVFFQGHLEYDSDTLMREYRRDVGRYIKGEISSYPSLPRGYFDRSTEQALTVLRDEAVHRRNTELLASVVTAMEKTTVENRWRSSATRIYRNWLECISARKGSDKRYAVPAHAVTR